MRSLLLFLFLASCLGVLQGLHLTPEVIEEMKRDWIQRRGFREMPPFANMTTTEIIEEWGYPTETHHVITEDGYILEMHRIPYGIDGPSAEPRPVAFVQHCLLCSSSDWVMDKPDRALAYLLADAGYDVWMNNYRGNTYSRNHTTLDPDVDKRQFWDFTWGEMGEYDLPAAIDYTLSVTGQTEIYYIGFSMGTTTFFVMMSEKPEYAEKIKVAALMGPVAYVEHVKGPLKLLGNYSDQIDLVLSLLGKYEVLPSDELMDSLAQDYCAADDVTQPVCENLLFLICGFDGEELDDEHLDIILSHTPAGTSTHTINHYGQLILPATFQMYDWGRIGNQNHYGQNEPPMYNLTVPTPPIGLFWGANDWLATPEDVERLDSEMQNIVLNHRVEWDKWNHLDFIWGIHAKEYVYDYVMNFIAQY